MIYVVFYQKNKKNKNIGKLIRPFTFEKFIQKLTNWHIGVHYRTVQKDKISRALKKFKKEYKFRFQKFLNI